MLRGIRKTRLKRFGLTLGGGGAKGLCHLAFIKALDEMGLRPAIIAGTSIGAIMGGFYASGMSGAEMEALLKENLHDINRMMDISLFRRSGIKRGKAAEELFYRHIPASRFEDLEIPLKVVATDFWDRREVIFDSGALIPAIRASIAMAGVFEPVTLNGTVLVDGGGVNPLPYDIIQNDCDITVAIDVSGEKTPPAKGAVPSVIENLLTTYTIMQSSIVKTKLNFAPPDIYIKPALTNIRATEFHRYDEIMEGVRDDVAILKDELERSLKKRRWFF
jgi:NTE family protein